MKILILLFSVFTFPICAFSQKNIKIEASIDKNFGINLINLNRSNEFTILRNTTLSLVANVPLHALKEKK